MSCRQVILLFFEGAGSHFIAGSCITLMTGSSRSIAGMWRSQAASGKIKERNTIVGGKMRTVIVMDLGWLAFAC